MSKLFMWFATALFMLIGSLCVTVGKPSVSIAGGIYVTAEKLPIGRTPYSPIEVRMVATTDPAYLEITIVRVGAATEAYAMDPTVPGGWIDMVTISGPTMEGDRIVYEIHFYRNDGTENDTLRVAFDSTSGILREVTQTLTDTVPTRPPTILFPEKIQKPNSKKS